MRQELLSRLRTHPVSAALLSLILLSFSAEAVFRAALFAQARYDSRPGSFELYGVGDSTMRGLPFPLTTPDIVSALFAGTLSGRELRVMNLSDGGNSTYTQALKAIRTLKYRDRRNPAAVLIYSGHAENITRLNSRHPFFLRACEQFKRKVLLHSLLFSKLVFTLERAVLFYGIRDLDHHEFYLRRIIEAALASGAQPVLATLVSNIEMEPSVNNSYLPRAEEVGRSFEAESRGEYKKALAQYTGLYESADPREAFVLRPYLAYRMGRCLQALGRPAAARARLQEALESDPFPLRAKPSQNAMIRWLAAEYAVPLVDMEALFISRSGDGFPGAERFINPMHPDIDGYLLMANAYAGRLEALFRDKVRNAGLAPAVIYGLSGLGAPERATPYITAGACLLWSGQGILPVPDRLSLAEKEFSRALRIDGGSGLAEIGLRITVISQKNRCTIPAELYDWFQGKRRFYEYVHALPGGEMAEADKLLRKWEGPGAAKMAPAVRMQ